MGKVASAYVAVVFLDDFQADVKEHDKHGNVGEYGRAQSGRGDEQEEQTFRTAAGFGNDEEGDSSGQAGFLKRYGQTDHGEHEDERRAHEAAHGFPHGEDAGRNRQKHKERYGDGNIDGLYA